MKATFDLAAAGVAGWRPVHLVTAGYPARLQSAGVGVGSRVASYQRRGVVGGALGVGGVEEPELCPLLLSGGRFL